MKRPASLVEVALLSRSHQEFGTALAEFLDEFNLEKNSAMLADEPPLLAARLQDKGVADAYLAAVAVYASRRISQAPAPWTYGAARFLREPWFASGGSSLRATLLRESPAAFRERNLFVSENALNRV